MAILRTLLALIFISLPLTSFAQDKDVNWELEAKMSQFQAFVMERKFCVERVKVIDLALEELKKQIMELRQKAAIVPDKGPERENKEVSED